MNDGFCDICLKFAGHEELKSTFGVLFCPDCVDRFLKLTKLELIEWYRKMIGVSPP